MAVYRVGDGFQDAHGRAVNEDGTLLDPSMTDADNLSAQAAEEAAQSAGAAPTPATAPKAKPAAKKGKRK